MKRLFSLLLALVACASFCSCKKKATLHLYFWADYISPELIEQFERENNCRIVYDTFDTNEALLAKLEAGATGYDIINPSHYVVDAMRKNNLLQPIDHTKLEFLDDLDMDLLKGIPDEKFEYSIPYMMSYTGIGYNKQVLKDFKPNWTMFERTDLQKRATLLDDKHETIGAALLHLGRNPNSTSPEDLAAAKAQIKKWMQNITKFENEQYKNGIASGEFYLVMGYSGDMMQVVNENPDLVGFAIPEEGTLISADMLCIPAQAPNTELAYRFINFLYKTEHAVKNIEHVCFLCPVKSAYPLLPQEVQEDPAVFLKPEVREKSAYALDLGEGEKLFNDLWAEIKAGR